MSVPAKSTVHGLVAYHSDQLDVHRTVLAFALLGALTLLAGVANAQEGAAASTSPTASSPAVPTASTVLELNDSKELLIRAPGEQFRRRLTLHLDGKPIAGVVRLNVGPLDGNLGKVVVATLSKPTDAPGAGMPELALPADTPREVVLSATLPQIDEYFTQLCAAVEGSATKCRPLRVSRPAVGELPVEVAPVQRLDRRLVMTTAFPLLYYAHTVTFSVKGLVDQDVQLSTGLFNLATKAGGSVTYGGWSIPKELTAKRGEITAVPLDLEGMPAGEYTGKLSLAAPGYSAKDTTFSFALRLSGFLAFTLTLVGAGLSLLLKRLNSRVRPRLVVRTAVSKLLVQARAVMQQFTLDVDEAAVLNSVTLRINRVFDEAMQSGDPPVGWPSGARDALALEDAKLIAFPNWLNARRRLASVSGLDATKQKEFEDRLEAARTALQANAKLEDPDATDLANLGPQIERAKRELAAKALERAKPEFDAIAGAVTGDEAKSEVQTAQLEIQRAGDLLKVGNFPGFQKAYSEAGRAALRGLASDLRVKLTATPGSDGASIAAVQATFNPIRDLVLGHLAKVEAANDLATARVHYKAALGMSEPVQAAALRNGVPGIQPALPIDIDVPDSGIGEQGPSLSPMFTTTLEDTAALSQQTRSIDNYIDAASVVTAGLLGVLLVWLPDVGWGEPTDLVAMLLWGMGLYAVSGQTFEGILALQGKVVKSTP